MSYTRTREVRGSVPGPPELFTRTRAVRGSVPIPPDVHSRTRAVRASVPTPFVVTIVSDVPLEAVEPGTVVTLTAHATGGTPVQYYWLNENGTVVDAGSDEHQVTAPRTLYGVNVYRQVAVIGTGASQGSAETTIGVLPHNEWITTPSGSWAPLFANLI